MSLTVADREAAAAALAAARERREPISPLTDRWPDLDLRDAYGIQQMFLASRPSSPRVGWKVGLTSDVMRAQLGVDEPDFAPLLADMGVPDGGTCPSTALISPRIEGEIAFIMGAELRGTDVSLDVAMAAVVGVVPALEIIDSRIADWRIRLADTVADHASCAFFVRGERVLPVDGLDLGGIEMVLEQDGREVNRGRGDAVLGHPGEALAWLVNTLGELNEGLEAGDFVMAGALSASIPVAASSRVVASFTQLGSVSVAFSDEDQEQT